MIDRYKAFVFDLDNTLIDENTYLTEAYRQIAAYTASVHTGYNSSEYFSFLLNTYTKQGRKHLFNKYIMAFNLPETIQPVLLDMLRNVKLPVPLEVDPHIAQAIRTMIAAQKPLFIASNGNRQQQQNKLSQVRWDNIDPAQIRVYFAADHKPKPAPDILLAILADHQLHAAEVLFIGDSETDEQAARSAGMDFCLNTSFFPAQHSTTSNQHNPS
jgi:FMN phosphatase YigB (HAD superfamily)